MNHRRAQRVLRGPEASFVTIHRTINEIAIQGTLLDESVDGIAVQLGRRCELTPNEVVDVLVGMVAGTATVTSVDQQGIAHRIGLRWLESRNDIEAELSI